MKSLGIGVLAVALLMGGTVGDRNDPATGAVEKGIRWLVSVQGRDGGWGQDGGETSFVRVGERLESSGNDVANTAVAAAALLRAGNTPTSGPYRESLRRAVEFILRNVEESPEQGLAVTRVTNTQIQRKLGPYIDTFLTSMVLAELDGNMGDARANRRVRASLEKCVAKVEKNQLKDGSWNLAGGWAPILGTSMASRSLYVAQQKGVKVEPVVVARVDEYTKKSVVVGGVPGGVVGGVMGGVAAAVPAASAGVPLYQSAQALEQLSRTPADRAKNAAEIRSVVKELSNARFLNGFGSMGGEEFFSYLNISDSLRRSGGPEWTQWNGQIKSRLVRLQNDDGTWAGHHCITGRVAVTSAAVLTLMTERK
ncbi:MAG: hypothetical protein HY238_04035 [Acidobacteria bacterium]|nr:hypothetical protein [Acidobacteriota bacterium]